VRCFSLQASIFNLLSDLHTECDESSITTSPDRGAIESATSEKSAVPPDERREVLRLVAAALKDPTLQQRCASHGGGCARIIVRRGAVIAKGLPRHGGTVASLGKLMPMDRGLQEYRGQFLVSLMMKPVP
jgi:hypothetical protein